jgi:nucleoside-diphosphate-sugar epimerase
METIGFIGVGRIGTEICKHLLGAGYRVVGYRRSSLAEFEKIGGTAADSPAHVGDQCDLWFPKSRSGRIRAVRQNQRIIRCDACDRPPTWNVCRQPVQVAAPA